MTVYTTIHCIIIIMVTPSRGGRQFVSVHCGRGDLLIGGEEIREKREKELGRRGETFVDPGIDSVSRVSCDLFEDEEVWL